MSTKKVDDYREMIESENRRVNDRLTVLCQFEGLLFTALSLGWDKNIEYVIVLATVGLMSSIALARALYNAESGIDKLYKTYILLPKDQKEQAGPVIGNYTLGPKDGIPRRWRFFLTPSVALPILLSLAWLCIAIIKLSFQSHDHSSVQFHNIDPSFSPKLDSNYRQHNG
jgi:hypothetical protein